MEKIEFGGIAAMPAETDRCFAMLPKQRWRGLWRDDLEGSRFCPAPARTCSHKTPGAKIWLGGGFDGAHVGMLYAVEFIGRRTERRGQYQGMFDHEMIVDIPISSKMVEEPAR